MSSPRTIDVTIHHLEMLDPRWLIPVPPTNDAAVRRARIPCPALNRFFYQEVGRPWRWTDRLPWSEDRWRAYVERPALATWIVYLGDTPAGYFELESQAEGNVEIAYFGLLPQFVGRRLGGYLLTVAVEQAWASGASRVWVHTCTLDHPHALRNYTARGFRQFREEVQRKVVDA